jgi:hypothetical protein
MSQSVIRKVVEAVAGQLNAHTLSLPFTAVASLRPAYDLADLKTLHVTVVPYKVIEKPLARRATQGDYLVDVAVQKKVNVDDADQTDPLLNLLEEIGDHFRFAALATVPPAICIGTEYIVGAEAGYAPEHLEKFRQFTGIRRLTFRLAR